MRNRIYQKYKEEKTDSIIDLEKCQKHLLGMFEKFYHFCNAKNISFFLLWGTLLGAKRDGKIIPWDDDIDVGMSSENFEKLLKYKDTLSLYGLKIVHFSTNPHIHSNGIRIYDNELFEFCKTNFGQYIVPVYIDVFKYCKVSKTSKTARIVKSIKKAYAALILKETIWMSKNLLKSILKSIVKFFGLIINSSYLHKKIEKKVSQLYKGEEDYFVTFPDTFHNAKINYFDKDTFEKIEIIDFENLKCFIPEKSDYVLNVSYGQWQIPNDSSGGGKLNKKFLIRTKL